MYLILCIIPGVGQSTCRTSIPGCHGDRIKDGRPGGLRGEETLHDGRDAGVSVSETDVYGASAE